MMDQQTLKFFDDGVIGDWVRVEYRVGMCPTTAVEGEFAGFGRTRRRTCYMRIRGIMLIPTPDIETIRVLIPAGCL